MIGFVLGRAGLAVFLFTLGTRLYQFLTPFIGKDPLSSQTFQLIEGNFLLLTGFFVVSGLFIRVAFDRLRSKHIFFGWSSVFILRSISDFTAGSFILTK